MATADHEKGALLLGAPTASASRWGERTERALRAALGDDGFAAKSSEGMRISVEEASKIASRCVEIGRERA